MPRAVYKLDHQSLFGHCADTKVITSLPGYCFYMQVLCLRRRRASCHSCFDIEHSITMHDDVKCER